MKKDNLYKDRRWTDIPKATVIGREEPTKEETERNKQIVIEMLKRKGIIKE